MKSTHISKSLLAIAVVAALSIGTALAKDKDEAKLEAKAKITKAEATKTALTKAPDGTVKDSEIEEEDGKLVWSFDITRPGTKDITEVLVDAMTGEIVKVEVEDAAAQAKEAKEDAEEAAGKKKGKKEDKD